jgi:hypothetical protein
MNIPEHIFHKIMLFNSHPVADLLKQESVVLRCMRYKSERTHGCPYDRGSADAYYGREPKPHYWTNGNGRNGGTVYELTYEQQEAYAQGYFNQDSFKDG